VISPVASARPFGDARRRSTRALRQSCRGSSHRKFDLITKAFHPEGLPKTAAPLIRIFPCSCRTLCPLQHWSACL